MYYWIGLIKSNQDIHDIKGTSNGLMSQHGPDGLSEELEKQINEFKLTTILTIAAKVMTLDWSFGVSNIKRSIG